MRSPSSSRDAPPQHQVATGDSDTEPDDDDESQGDGEMSKWFGSADVEETSGKVDRGKEKFTPEADSETDPDSDYDEARMDDGEVDNETLDELDDKTIESSSMHDTEETSEDVRVCDFSFLDSANQGMTAREGS
jgi:hypothetical protein